MDEKTSKLLQDLATHARQVAAQIQQPRPSNAITFTLTLEQVHDKKLQVIRDQLLGVADDIDSYSSAST